MYQLDTHDTSHVDEWPYLPKIIDPTFPKQPMISQHTKKVVFLGEFKLQKKIMQSILLIKSFQAFDLIEMTFDLVNASYRN